MSYSVAPPAPQARPGTVTVASLLLYAIVAIEIITTAVTAPGLLSMQDAADAYTYDTPEQAQAIKFAVVIVPWVSIGFAVLVAICLSVLAIFNSKGKNPARIVTWVVGGLWVLCSGCGLLSTAAFSGLTMPQGDDRTTEIMTELQDGVPAWSNAVSTIASVVVLLMVLAVIVLLAMPASNDFFRKAAPAVWVPPTYPSTYPGTGIPPTYPPANLPPGSSGYNPVPPSMEQPTPPAPPAPPAAPTDPNNPQP